MVTIETVQSKVCPRWEATIAGVGGNNESDFFRQVILFCLDWTAASSGIIAPCGEELSGDLAVLVSHNFSEEVQLPFGDLEIQTRYAAEPWMNVFVHDLFVNYLLYFFVKDVKVLVGDRFLGVWGHFVETGGFFIGKLTNSLHEFIPFNGFINLEKDVSLVDSVKCVPGDGVVCSVDLFEVWGKDLWVFGIGGGEFTVW